MSNTENTPQPSPAPGPFALVPYGDPNESYGVNIIVCAVITWAGAAAFVTARFYTRWVIRRVLGWEDWMIVAALVFSAGNTVAMIDQSVHDLGKHLWYVKQENFMPLMRAGWYAILFYVLSLACTKISILLLYLRILTYDWARKATYVLLVVVILANLIYSTVITLTACVPIHAWWTPFVPGAVCHIQKWWWANTGMHLITDFFIFTLPLPLIITLRISWRQRLLLLFIFTFGFFICIVSILRLVMLVQFAEHPDFSWDNIPISYWSCIEVNFAIICACQMTLKPLVARLFPSLFTEKSGVEQQHAAVSIGGRPMNFDGRSKEQMSPVAGSTGISHKRRSWYGGGHSGPGIRLDSDTPIIEEDRPMSMRDLESQKAEESGLPTEPSRVHVRETEGMHSESSERLSELGPEARNSISPSK